MDRESANQAIGLLGVLIGEIMEDHAPMAISAALPRDAAEALRQAGEDIVALALAMQVAARRGDVATAPG